MSIGDREITRFRTQKAGALLAYLALNQRKSHPREELVEIFWPDAEPEAGRSSLRTALTSLRHQLDLPGYPSDSVLISDRSNVRIHESAEVDAVRFLAALRVADSVDESQQVGHLQAAVDLYAGDLLPGIYDDWVVTERERHAQAFYAAVRRLTTLLMGTGNYAVALDYAQRAVNADPLDEDAHCDLIRILSALGRKSSALQQAETLRKILKEELGSDLSAQTAALVESVRQGSGATVDVGFSRTPVAPVSIEAPAPLAQHVVSPPPPASRLPRPITRFFGRESELSRVEDLLSCGSQPARIVTVTGPGGSGKTRFALEAAHRLNPLWSGSVWFVPLADIVDSGLIAKSISDAMSASKLGASDPVETIGGVLGQHRGLVVLDNFEQLVETGTEVVTNLLERVPGLSILMTSRQRLNIGGEFEVPLAPLPVPKRAASPEMLLEFDSIRLFVDRSQATRSDFQITQRNGPSVAALCEKLDGIPLAIELAAALSSMLTPQQILAQIDARFDLLVNRRRDAVARHKTLRAAIDWSFDLLDEPLQRFFSSLSAFRGGFTLEAAEGVCDDPLAFDNIAELRERSLLIAEAPAEESNSTGMRYRLLEALRQYADERLLQEERGSLQKRHFDYFLGVTDRAQDEMSGRDQAACLDRLEMDIDNLRAALRWGKEQPDQILPSLRFAANLCRFWDLRGYVTEGRQWMSTFLNLPHAQGLTPERALALNRAGVLALIQSDYTHAKTVTEESLRIWKSLRNAAQSRKAMANLAAILIHQGDLVLAEEVILDALDLAREIGSSPHEMFVSLNYLGVLRYQQGDYSGARAAFEDSVKLARDTGDVDHIAIGLENVAGTVLRMNDLDTAETLYAETMRMKLAIGAVAGMSNTLEGFAEVESARGNHSRCATLLSAAATIRQKADIPQQSPNLESVKQALESARESLGSAEFESAWSAGEALSMSQAAAYALREITA